MNAFVSVLLFCAATGVGGFSVTSQNKDVKVKENQEADLTCSYSPDFGTDARVEWKFFDNKGSQVYVYYGGKLTESYVNRVTMYSGFNLRISQVTRADNGTYICEVSGMNQFKQVDIELTVLGKKWLQHMREHLWSDVEAQQAKPYSCSKSCCFDVVQIISILCSVVPPSVPMCKIPTSVTTGKPAKLFCHDSMGSPSPMYRWYKDNTLLPSDPTKNSNFRNSTYRVDEGMGTLEFPSAALADTGEYYCEASNIAGPPQKCRAVKMEVRDLNTGGIVAGVIVGLLLLALLIIGVWYAKKRGHLNKLTQRFSEKPKQSSVYQAPAYKGNEDDDEDGPYRQKSSFVV